MNNPFKDRNPDEVWAEIREKAKEQHDYERLERINNEMLNALKGAKDAFDTYAEDGYIMKGTIAYNSVVAAIEKAESWKEQK